MAKRIVVCSDGTWNDPEKPDPTNVLRVARGIAPRDGDVEQVVFYDWGVGTYHDRVGGGAFGVGLEKNVQDGYRFIVQNYAPGDRIYLFGFSRGAYTVRCLAGMLNNCGILKREHAARIPQAFRLYKNGSQTPSSPRSESFRRELAYGPGRGRVDFLGVWDTVGALGIPTRALAFVEKPDLFFDPEIGSNVRVGRHAVSLDERRGDFVPTLWGEKVGVDVREVWFAGVHSDVGGGYAPTPKGRVLSDIPLAWMAREAGKAEQSGAAGLQFRPGLYRKQALDPLAPAHKSDKGFFKVLPSRGRDLAPDAIVHDSVRVRYEEGRYQSTSIDRWIEGHGGYWGELET